MSNVPWVEPVHGPVRGAHTQVPCAVLRCRQVADDSLRVMDETAVTLCKENNIPVIVFSISEKGNILKAALGEQVGTIVADALESEMA